MSTTLLAAIVVRYGGPKAPELPTRAWREKLPWTASLSCAPALRQRACRAPACYYRLLERVTAHFFISTLAYLLHPRRAPKLPSAKRKLAHVRMAQ